jgi:hypothetical protein
MRTILAQQISERRRSRRARSPRQRTRAETPAINVVETPTPTYAADVAARQVRAAGGPLDSASYTCGCGCMFAAAVTTTVECPHCGGTQAW